MKQIKAGDRSAFSALVQRFGSSARMTAMSVLGDMQMAEDVVQDVFLKIWTVPDKYDGKRAKLSTWLHRVVVNRCIDVKRRKTPDPLPEGFDQPANDLSAENLLMIKDQKKQLMRALDVLSERQRVAVTLSYLDELTNSEAAEVMELNIKAYESLLVRARAKLREFLNGQRDLLNTQSAEAQHM